MSSRDKNKEGTTLLFCRAEKQDFQSREKRVFRWGGKTFTIEHWIMNVVRTKNALAFPFSVKKFQNRRVLHSLKASILGEINKQSQNFNTQRNKSLYIFYLRTNKNKIDMKVKKELQKEAVLSFAELRKHDTMPSGAAPSTPLKMLA